MYGLWWLHQEPDDVDEDLDEDQTSADDKLALWRDKVGPLGRPARGVEDPADPIGLREEGAVDHREAQANRELLRQKKKQLFGISRNNYFNPADPLGIT